MAATPWMVAGSRASMGILDLQCSACHAACDVALVNGLLLDPRFRRADHL